MRRLRFIISSNIIDFDTLPLIVDQFEAISKSEGLPPPMPGTRAYNGRVCIFRSMIIDPELLSDQIAHINQLMPTIEWSIETLQGINPTRKYIDGEYVMEEIETGVFKHVIEPEVYIPFSASFIDFLEDIDDQGTRPTELNIDSLYIGGMGWPKWSLEKAWQLPSTDA